MIEVMTAKLQGKDIEVRISGKDEWVLTSMPKWNWNLNDYRIKTYNINNAAEELSGMVERLMNGNDRYKGEIYRILQKVEVI